MDRHLTQNTKRSTLVGGRQPVAATRSATGTMGTTGLCRVEEARWFRVFRRARGPWAVWNRVWPRIRSWPMTPSLLYV